MKRIICLFFALLMCFSFSVTALAEIADSTNSEIETSESTTEEPTRAEETEWYYRITGDGLVQKRLWSLTYGYWKTDWITIGHT